MDKWFLVFIIFLTYEIKGQSVEYAVPQKLASSINTRFEDTMPMLSPGGDTLYFTRISPGEKSEGKSGHDIWYSVRENGEWSEAKNDLLNLDQFNGVVGIGDGGQRLYLLKYQDHTGALSTASAGISSAMKFDGEWLEPQKLNFKNVFTNNTFFGFFMSQNEQLLLISMRGLNSMGKEDLYVSFRDEDNQWTLPRHLGPVINSRGFEISPYLSNDGKTLYFSSDGHDGFGNADIFVSTRLDDSWVNWSPPKNLGKPINSSAFDAYFIEGKENEVFFASNRKTSLADIYQAKIIDPDDQDGLKDGVLALDGDGKAGSGKNGNDPNDGDGKAGSGKNGNDPNGGDGKAGSGKNGNDLTADNGKAGNGNSEDQNSNDPNSNLHGDENTTSGNSSDRPPMTLAGAIYFEYNSDLLTDRAKYILTDIARQLKSEEGVFIELVGYTDDVGGQRFNLKLSRKRAKATRDFLAEQGLDKDQISMEGKGILNTAAINSEEEIRRLQRKVDITYHKMPQ